MCICRGPGGSMRSRERSSQRPDQTSHTPQHNMRAPRVLCCGSSRQFLVLLTVVVVSLGVFNLPQFKADPKPYVWGTHHSDSKRVHSFVQSVLAKECRPGFARREMSARFNGSSQFDTVIRLNSGPVGDYSPDVGTRTSIRMSYPEGTPRSWDDVDSGLQFVAVVYKSVDLNWLRAMLTRRQVSLWDWLFFWKEVPDKIPIELSQFRVLNPEIIREAALDLLHLPEPQPRLWGWDQNVPTIGVSALNLATYLCDEVSLAGFGYNLSQQGAPLHYYDSLPMTSMLHQPMHNVDRERALLRRLASAGVISDLTGGVHCSFCPRGEGGRGL
ncbi:hypothetical protein AAFF_G00290060 [Aldrovandia affinis]|uniref:Lactosylceramide alpha-2,3-sialyltransferase n=1 Tax=Aldrovandia affinis TaxID=143900 RepID=A0AAD7R9L6_9TELE|nr:hypothetical protein AAFF_G00290060 [Aldrovandia affinis]